MDLTKGSILKGMIRFTIPIIIIQFLSQAYAIIDNVVVARFVSEEALSVLSTVNSALTVGYCLIQGLSSASTILVGNLFGAHAYEKLHTMTHTLLVGAGVVSLILFAVYSIGAAPIFAVLKVPAEILPACEKLMFLYALSLPPTLLCSACTAMLNGMGNSKTPMIISVCSQILNIILDILAVAVLGFGVEGAAAASLISVVVALVWTYHHLTRDLTQLNDARPRAEFSCIGQYVPLAVPSILQQSIMSVGSLMLQVLVNVAGIAYINGYNVACTLNNLFLLPVISCCAGFETFAAQNLGSKNEKRVKQGFLDLLGIGTLLCLVLSLSTFLFARPLIGLYLTDEAGTAFTFAKQYLFLLIPNYLLLLAKYSVDSLFKAQMKIYLFTLSSLIALGCRIALGYLMTPSMGLTALAYATLIGNFIAAAFDWGCLFIKSRHNNSFSN